MLQTSMASARYYREQGQLLLRWASAVGDHPAFATKLESLAHEYLMESDLLEQPTVRGGLDLQDEFSKKQMRNGTLG